MIIVKAEPTDAEVLTTISFNSKGVWNYPQEYFEIWKDELTISEEYIRDNVVFKCLDDQGEIIGYYSLVHFHEDLQLSKITIAKGDWLEHMFIEPQRIKQGIGSNLVTHLKEYCRTYNIKELSVLSDPNVKDFYEKQGFTFIKEYPSTIEDRTTPLLKITFS